MPPTRSEFTGRRKGRRDIRPLLAVLMLLTLGGAAALAQPGGNDKQPAKEQGTTAEHGSGKAQGHDKGHGHDKGTPPSTEPAPGETAAVEDTSSTTSTMEASASTTTSTTTTTATTAYPPPATETTNGKFIVKCPFSHRRQVDPIVSPGPAGTLSGHMHDFFGNRSTDSFSTYATMIAGGTTCALLGDSAAYWIPTLLAPDGTPVKPKHIFAYYRNKPVNYGTTTAFPPDFRLIAGGHGTFPGRTFWSCHSGSGEYDAPPLCSGSDLKINMFLPNCWDGVRTDSPDHRSHVVYPTGSGKTACPSSHPVKLPDIRFFVHFPSGTGGPGYRLSDGTTLPHMDFWNTWNQAKLEQLVRDCLQAGVECGRVSG